ncbi:MAG: hypothetical protein QXT06_03725 [Candidatus Bathyarchaeia archaeon]
MPETYENIESYGEIAKFLQGQSEDIRSRNLSIIAEYIKFTKLNPKELIEEAVLDKQRQSPEYLPEQRLYSFFAHLLAEKKMDVESAIPYFNTVRIFYSKNGCPLKVSLPRALRYAEYMLGVKVKGLLVRG